MTFPSCDYSLRPKAVLITGAAGFIGKRMTTAAQVAGLQVIGLGRAPQSGVKADGAAEHSGLQGRDGPDTRSDPTRYSLPATHFPSWITADLTGDAPIVLPPGIDTIIHLAGKAHALAEVAQDEDDYFRINTEGTRRILEAAQRAGVRAFVLFSTVKAAGEGFAQRETSGGCAAGACEHADLQRPGEANLSPLPAARAAEAIRGPVGAWLDESCAELPDTPYGQSKRAAERLVLEGGYVPHPVVLRPCLVYGPTPKGNLEKMITAVRRGRFPPLPEVGNRRSMVHVDDVIAAALLAAEKPAAAGQVYIVADNEPFSTRQLFEWICLAAGRRVPRWTMPLWLLQMLGRVGDGIGKLRGRRFVFDSDALAKLTGSAWYSSAKLQRELGWKPVHTLRETMGAILGAAPRTLSDK